MKEKYLSYKYLILIIFLFTCLFIFSTTSLALIPGDFGSTGGGPPDGVVDFEDLMIFAMAYGSTPPDANWNPVCDIAGPGGPAPDGVIDFEDLMIFAMHYRETYAITEVKAIAITTPHSLGPVTPPVPASSMIGLEDRTNKIGEKSLILQNIKFDKLKAKEGDSYYAVLIYWNVILEENFDEDINFKVYKSIDGVNYDNIVSDDYFYLDELYFDGEEYIIGGIDIDVDPSSGNTYSYYVTAYGSDWETNPSQIVSIDSWLPSCCSLNSPQDGSLITEPNPAFTWDSVGVSNFPYGSICSGESDLWVGDSTESAQAWWITFPDLTTSSATYNQDGQGTPLTPGHGYYWDSYSYGYNLDGDLIALSICEALSFNYKITEGVVSNVYAIAVTSKLGYEDYYVEIYYNSYPEATDYKIYRSVNGGNYELLPDCLSREFPPDNNWHNLQGAVWPSPPPFWDDDVSPENTYSYYVIACGDGWETAPSEIVTIDTWLPFCVLISPPNNSAITEPNPTFTWDSGVSSLPYGSIYSGKARFFVNDQTDIYRGWLIYFDDITTSSATYNQDGQADSLVAGHDYTWGSTVYGYNENGNLIAVSEGERWGFGYLVEEGIVTGVYAIAITSQLSMSKFEDKIEQLEEEDKLPSSYCFNEITELKEGFTHYAIKIGWHNYYGISGLKGYRVYRSINGGDYTLIHDWEAPPGYDYSVYDNDVSTDNDYAYYVTAYGNDWESDPSQIVTIDTWLPLCVLTSPLNNSVISEPNPTFTWDTGVSNLPYGSIYSGESKLWVFEKFTEGSWGQVWQFPFNNLTTSTITYNQDGQAIPLVSGHSYSWNLDAYGYDENDHLIALSWNDHWNFDYIEE
jgi:hypothetical protein